ncbi:MAG: tetratricopeptide repeat protein [Phycisphaerae bacterium]
MPNGESQNVELVESVREFFEARDSVRRGICLLNAGQYDRAAESFSAAIRLNPASSNLRQYLAQCHVGCRNYGAAAGEMAELVAQDPEDITARIRHAMFLWKGGDLWAAIASLRRGVAYAPDCAEIHFQLGTLLAAAGADEEAELRFTQALSLDARHIEAMVSLAMCHAARCEVGPSLQLLTKAQRLRPHDARIGHLLSIASIAAPVDHASARPAAVMPEEPDVDEQLAVDQLSRIIESDQELVDAFLELPLGDIDEEFYQATLVALDRALMRCPERADLRFRYGRVLDRLGRCDEAIASIEHAVAIDPQYVDALIHLAKLYHKTHCPAEATDRLERVLELGAGYADVYVLLGQLYRDAGQTGRARSAFRQAIRINGDYAAAKEALETLPA